VWIEAWCDLVTKWKPTFWAEEKTQITFDDVQDRQSSPGTDRTQASVGRVGTKLTAVLAATICCGKTYPRCTTLLTARR
jgi:hypothetical protein